jgi:hypothetical protein
MGILFGLDRMETTEIAFQLHREELHDACCSTGVVKEIKYRG